MIFNEGISKEGDLLDLATEAGVVEKSGTWYAFGGENIGQGRENAKQFLKENAATEAEIREKVFNHYGLNEESEEDV